MTTLEYSVYVAPSKPAVSDDLPPGKARRLWSPTASTLIFGQRDAVLVDPLMTALPRPDLRAPPCRATRGQNNVIELEGEQLQAIERLAPTAVVAGRKRDGDPDSPDDTARTRRYIQQFDAAAEKADGYLDLYEAMVALYPDRINRGVLCNSRKSVKA